MESKEEKKSEFIPVLCLTQDEVAVIMKRRSEDRSQGLPAGEQQIVSPKAVVLNTTGTVMPLAPVEEQSVRSLTYEATIGRAPDSGLRLIVKPVDLNKAEGTREEEKPMTKVSLVKSVPFVKKDTAKRLVYGVVYEPDVVDSQGDYANSEEIEKACHLYMEMYQKASVEHGEVNERIRVVENYCAPVDMTLGDQKVVKGTWIQVMKVHDDEAWAKVESGELTGFSMEGVGERIYSFSERRS